jgi:hypothetical protein
MGLGFLTAVPAAAGNVKLKAEITMDDLRVLAMRASTPLISRVTR